MPDLVRRTLLAAGEATRVPAALDAVADGTREGAEAGLFRAFFRAGTPPEAFAAEGGAGCAAVRERRAVSGGAMVVAAGPGALALADGGRLPVAAAPAEWDFLAGRNCLLGLRSVEPAEAVLEWLSHHARHHGAGGAVIVNRAADPDGAFAAALAADLPGRAPGMRVAVLDSPVPLGKPGLPPESHPILAPDAPGKDRMERPADDPWLAPLGEWLVYEIAKWRFLARARAVLALDVSDLLAGREGAAPSAFDLCRAAQGGVILLVGRRAYPWRVRAGRPARFGDHVCRQFDARRGIARWGAAPDIAGLENTWRPVRVANARPATGGAVPFWRAMALRVPGRKPSELVPKSSLIEDPALVALAQDAFGHRPVRPPVSTLSAPARSRAEAGPDGGPEGRPDRGTHGATHGETPGETPGETNAGTHGAGRTAIVTTMKNEGPFILEWIAYHRAIGVDDFLVYTNDCTDGTDALLDALAARGIVVRRDNPFRAMDLPPQHAALQAAEQEAVIRDSAWAICMDVDEFIDVKLGDGTLAALYAAMEAAHPGANMIALTWRLFGNADVHGYEDRFVIEQFTRCAPELVRKPHQAWGFKTLFRNIAIYKKLGVHRPKGLRPDLWDQVVWLNGSGRRMPREMYRNGWRSTLETYGYDWVSLNHYAVRSAESFLVKRDRGRVNHVDRDQGMAYWFRMNHNAVEDRSILRHLPRLRAEFDRLTADGEIAAAHRACVAAHRARIAELRARPDQEAFYEALAGERMQRLSRMLHHFGSAVFNAGPGVIPPDLHRRDLPADFFFTVEHAGEAEH